MMTLELFQAAKPALWRYAMRLTRKRELAEELLQETFLRAWKSRESYADNNAAGWLASIMHNAHVTDSRIRRKSVDALNFDFFDSVVHALQTEGSLDSPSNAGYAQILARQALERLTPIQSHILYCIGIQRYSYKSVADSMGMPVNTVKSHVHRARVKLAEVA